MISTSASAQIALAVKATLDRHDLPQISKEPTILTVKNFTIELCQMAAAVESEKAGVSLDTCISSLMKRSIA